MPQLQSLVPGGLGAMSALVYFVAVWRYLDDTGSFAKARLLQIEFMSVHIPIVHNLREQ